VSVKEKIRDIASRAEASRERIGNTSFTTPAHDRCHRYSLALANVVAWLRGLELTIGTEDEPAKLRQAVKDLTASSERLRELNRKAVRKAADQAQEIQRLKYLDPYPCSLYSLLNDRIAKIRLDLERTQKQLQAALAANQRLDERIVELINQRDRFQRLFESVDQSNNELVFRLNNLPAQPRLSDSDRQKLFSVCRTVTEVIAGRPAQPGDVLTDAEVGEIFKAAHSSDSD
jgi:hypothetical protein